MRKYCRKGCPLYAIQVLESVEDDKPSLEDHPTLREYRDVFPEEVPGLPSVIAQFVARSSGYEVEGQTGVTGTYPTQCHHDGEVLSL